MNSSAESVQTPRRPTLPALLALPLAWVPGLIHSTVLSTALNTLFAARIREGEFEFLRDRVLAIQVRDAKVEYRFRFTVPTGFVAVRSASKSDLIISGAIYDFLALVTRREDSDTLFFHRRVVMEGDTALGLELKNLLDGMDLEAIGGLAPLLRAANGFMTVFERLGSR